jgi:hypothetical protein
LFLNRLHSRAAPEFFADEFFDVQPTLGSVQYDGMC